MSTLDVLLRLRAAETGKAQPRTSLRHRHLARHPLVVVMYRMAGESAAPLGLMYGTRASKPTLLVAPEPRSREIRFREVFNPFAADLCRYIEDKRTTDPGGSGWADICADGPQLMVPNTATAEFVGPLIGRSLRYLTTTGPYAVPDQTPLAGAHLSWLGQQAELPGSSVLLPATELLRRHWASGISDLETEDLHVQLAWIDPPKGKKGTTAAAVVEARRFDGTLPAAGPAPDPSWDRDVLAPLIDTFNKKRDRAEDHATVSKLGKPIRQAVAAALRPTWDATWQAIDLLRALPEAPSVADRWATDRREFTRHARRAENGDLRFRTRDSVKQAAFLVSIREDTQAKLDVAEALDDPMVLARSIADGQAIRGTVLDSDPANRTITLELAAPCSVPIGTDLFWTVHRGKCSSIVVGATAQEPFEVTLRMDKGKTLDKYYPRAGDVAVYSPFAEKTWKQPPPPASVPWTHLGAVSPEPEPEVPE